MKEYANRNWSRRCTDLNKILHMQCEIYLSHQRKILQESSCRFV